jgi:RND family efflux transporter MFP subunit
MQSSPNHEQPSKSPHDPHDETIPKNLPKVSTGSVLIGTAIFVILLIALFFVGYFPYRHGVEEIDQLAKAAGETTPIVNVVRPQRQEEGTDLDLPADVRAFQSTSLFPRTSGYLSKLNVDIGDHVKDGQVLAVIDTPEVEAQLAQAKATVEQMQANVGKTKNDFDLSKTTLDRYQNFGKSGGVTQQQVDEKSSAYAQAKATYEAAVASLASANAEVQRLTAVQNFSRIVAPFAGTITARNFDVGALLSSTGSKELFRMEQTDTLRVFVNVPQTYATAIKTGQPADLLVSNYPGTPFPGKVARSTASLDSNTRTIKFEVDVPNPDGKLFAGMYGQVKFTVKPPTAPLIVPTSALVFNAKGMRVATVTDDHKIKYLPISVGRDFGTEVEVSTGLDGK